ncbi:MAG TPA: hypothetical protein VHI13_14310 [Candidatus Kapabacteria bacterium]|nr:hypothetical protein [Candidatus Kapabacteria bacterium]
MRKLLAALAVLTVVAVAGCTDTVTDPAGQAIVGVWKSGTVGLGFDATTSLTANFKSGGDAVFTIDGTDVNGTYTTSGSSASSTIREITITLPSKSLKGIYAVSGTVLSLEVVPNPAPSGIVGPDAATGIGSTTSGGSATTAYVNVLNKQ